MIVIAGPPPPPQPPSPPPVSDVDKALKVALARFLAGKSVPTYLRAAATPWLRKI